MSLPPYLSCPLSCRLIGIEKCCKCRTKLSAAGDKVMDKCGAATFMKLDSSGGRVNRQTCREQLLYEVQDPARYTTPHVTADCTPVQIEHQAPNRMKVHGSEWVCWSDFDFEHEFMRVQRAVAEGRVGK